MHIFGLQQQVQVRPQSSCVCLRNLVFSASKLEQSFWRRSLLLTIRPLTLLKSYCRSLAESLEAKLINLIRTAQWSTFQRHFNS